MCSCLKKSEEKFAQSPKRKNVWAWVQNKFGGVPKVHLKKMVLLRENQDKVKG